MASKITNDTRSAKNIAEDLSLINGLPNKINLDYIKNIEQLLIYRICEQRLSGKKSVIIDLPLVGTLTISIRNDVKSELNLKPKDLVFEFNPLDSFSRDTARAFNNEGFELPEMIANRYGDRILKVYNEFLD